LVNVIAVASKSSSADIAAASVIVTVAFHKVSSIEGGRGIGKGFSAVKHLGKSFKLGGFGNGGSSNNGENGKEDKDVEVHC
jgi:hypothetical protein